MAENGQRIIQIWRDPESRIQFLESVMAGHEWKATIYQPDIAEDGAAATSLKTLSLDLKARGLEVETGQDEHGVEILKVTKFGKNSSPSETFGKMGLVKGAVHHLRHIEGPLGAILGKAIKTVKFVTSDSARLCGTLYIIGDSLIGNMFGLKPHEDKMTEFAMAQAKICYGKGATRQQAREFLPDASHTANRQMAAVGGGALVQSIVYIAAKQGSEQMSHQLMNTLEDASKTGKDIFDAETWQHDIDARAKHKAIQPVQRFISRYPLQIGAVAQIVGQLFSLNAERLRFGIKRVEMGVNKHDKDQFERFHSGAIAGLATATLSIIGWSMMLVHGKEHEGKKHKWRDPRRLWEELQESPNKFASVMIGLASLGGMLSGRYQGNDGKTLGYAAYMLGDGVIYATKSENYGRASEGHASQMAEAAEKFIQGSPLILGKQEERQLVGLVSAHLAKHVTAERAHREKRHVMDGETEKFARQIAIDVNAKLPTVNHRTNEVAAQIAQVVERFPKEDTEMLAQKLAIFISELPGVSITPDELKAHVLRQVEDTKERPNNKPTIEKVGKPLSELIFSVPGASDLSSVDRLYELLQSDLLKEPGKSDAKGGEALQNVVHAQAEADVAKAIGQAGKSAAQENQTPMASLIASQRFARDHFSRHQAVSQSF